MILTLAGGRGAARALRAAIRAGTAAAFVALATSAQAQKVALVRPGDDDAVLAEAFNRLQAELRLEEFEITVVDGAPEDVPDGLRNVARRAGARGAAVIHRREGETSVDVWVGAPGELGAVRTIDSPTGAELPTVLAIRAVDHLRASLRDLRHEPAVPRPEEPATRSAEATPTPFAPRPWEIRAEAVLVWNGATIGASYGAALGLARRLSPLLQLGLFVSAPMTGATWETPQGSAFVRQQLAWLELRAATSFRSLDFGANAAAGVHDLRASGAARPPLLSASDEVTSFAAVLGAQASLRLTGALAAGLTLRAIALSPRPGIGVGASSTVLTWPLLSVSACLIAGF